VIVAAGLKVAARQGLTSGRFRHGPLDLVDDKWTEVDPNDAATREALRAHVGSYVRVYPTDVARLAEFNMAMRGGRLVELERGPAKAPVKAPTKEGRPGGP
jgi:hypothetical protein